MPNHVFTVGFIGAGTVAHAIAGHALDAGHRVLLSNRRGPESLAELVAELGSGASAVSPARAADADIVVLAVHWDAVEEAVAGAQGLEGKIVIDATNQWASVNPMIAADLGDQTGSERNRAFMPGARIVKAFNTLYGRITAQNPRRTDGNLVAFLAGDDSEAKDVVATFITSIGFAPVDMGGLRDGGRLMQVGGGPLSGLHVVKLF